MNNLTIIYGCTARRANIIATRTSSETVGIIKSLMIETLKAKLANSITHFWYLKKDGSLREAWGTCQSNIAEANINGRGYSRDSVNCIAYWDCEKGGWRSLRWENIVTIV